MKSERPDRETIAVGVILNESREKILLSRRRADVHNAGMWELPGGKVNPGEPPAQALKREIAEELGITVAQTHSLTIVDHDYADKKIRLHVLVIDNWSGSPAGKEGQLIEWVSIVELKSREFPRANRKITKLIGLPPLYLITPDQKTYNDEFLNRVGNFLENGLRLIQFRSKAHGDHQHEKVVRRLVQECDKYSARLLYNGTAEEAEGVGAHGVHLNSSRLLQLQVRPLPDDSLVAASCHNARDLDHAAAIGVDFCVLSPVHLSSTHPMQIGIGWDQFSTLAGRSKIPVYALGGVRAEELSAARNSGAHGIAMISGIWNARDPLLVISQLHKS